MNVTCSTTSGCDFTLNSKCVFYEGVTLPSTGIATNDSLQVALQKIEAAIAANLGGGLWGEITGDIEDQTDLIAYLEDNYAPITDGAYWKTAGTSNLTDHVFIESSTNRSITFGNGSDLIGSFTTWVDDIDFRVATQFEVSIAGGSSGPAILLDTTSSAIRYNHSFFVNSKVEVSSTQILINYQKSDASVSHTVVFDDNGIVVTSDGDLNLLGSGSGSFSVDSTLDLTGNLGVSINGSGGSVNISGTSISLGNDTLVDGTFTITDLAAPSGQSYMLVIDDVGLVTSQAIAGGGITNNAANTELMMSDGTDAVGSDIYIPSNGNIDLGNTSLAGAVREINAIGSATDVGLYLNTRGAGPFNVAINDTVALNISGSTGYMGISNKAGFQAPDKLLHVQESSSTTNAVTVVAKLSSVSTGTPATGIGTGLQFEVETAAANNEIIGQINAVTTSVTSTSESSDLVFYAMGSGTIGECFRLSQLAGPTTRIRVQNQTMDVDSTGWKVNNDTRFTTNVKIGVQESTVIDRRLHVEDYSTGTNTVLYPFRMSRVVQTGSGAAGIGVGMEFEIENGSGTNVVGSLIESVATSVTAGAENIDLVFKTMTAGTAAERFRWISATGRLNVTGDIVASGAIQSGTGFTATNGSVTATIDDASSSGVTPILDIIHTTSGSPANGIGVSMRMQVETSNGNTEVGAIIEAVTTDVTLGSEDFDVVFRIMAAGAAASEKLRIKGNTAAITLFQVNTGSAYSITNVTPDRAYDANATTTDELADVLGTLIADLKLTGILA